MLKMKSFFVCCFLCILFLLTLACAVSGAGIAIKPVKAVFNSGETAQAVVELEGIKLRYELSVSDFVLLDSNGNKIVVSQSLVKTGNGRYYTYFDMPLIYNSDFSFGVKDVQYFEGTELKKNSFLVPLKTSSENFSVSLRPAYVSFLNIEPYVQPTITFIVKNKGDAVNVSFSSRDEFLVPTVSRFFLNKNEQRQVEVRIKVLGKVQDVFEGDVIVKYGGGGQSSGFEYRVPVLITRKGFVRVNVTVNETRESGLNKSLNESFFNEGAVRASESVSGEEIEGKAEYGSLVLVSPSIKAIDGEFNAGDVVKPSPFIFRNIGNFTLDNITVSFKGLEDILVVDRQMIELLPSDSETVIMLSLNMSNAKSVRYKGELVLTAINWVNFSLPFNVNVKFEGKKNETDAVNATRQLYKNYSELNVSPAEKKGGFVSWFIILGVVLVIAVVIYYLYKKGKPRQEAYESLVESYRQRR